MIRVSSFFVVENGILATGMDIRNAPSKKYGLPLLRPSHSFQKLIAGFVDASSIPKEKIFDADSLIVSTDGEGSHSYSYVVPYRFAPNSNVSVLVPKQNMTVKSKLFYSLAITQSRWRFSYGRKPKSGRLEKLELPSIPKWVSTIALADYKKELERLLPSKKLAEPIRINEFCYIKDLFDVQNGHNYELNHLIPDPNGVAFVSRTSHNNGISGRVSRTSDDPTPSGYLTVALSGSVLEVFLQNEPTYQGWHIAILVPKTHMTTNEKLWYATAIRQHSFRFNYGRQANRQLPNLLIPKCPESFV